MFEKALMRVKKVKEQQQSLVTLDEKVEEDQLSEELVTEQRTRRAKLDTSTSGRTVDFRNISFDEDALASVEQPVVTESNNSIVKDSIWFLDEAKRIQEERGAIYDSTGSTKERSMGKTVTAFNAITGKDLTEAEGWLLLQLLKDARQWANPTVFHLDSATDGVSYSSLKAEALAANK
jgi:hypothetical protein